jgi:tetratricopeptide (TPR) repeat protein
MKRVNMAIVIVLIMGLLVACEELESPAKGAREWLEAVFEFDGIKMLKRTCAAQQLNVQMSGGITSAILILAQQFMGQQELKVDMSNMHYDVISQNSNTAQVKVNGKIIGAVLASAQVKEFDTTFAMQHEDGEWKWCGELGVSSGPFTLPTPTVEPTVVQSNSTLAPTGNCFDYVEAGDLDSGLTCYKNIIAAQPDAGWAYNMVMHIYAGKGDRESANEWGKKMLAAVKKSDEKALAYLNMGVNYYYLGNLDLAIEYLVAGSNLEVPNDAYRSDILVWLAWSYQSDGQQTEACRYFRQALDQAQKNNYEWAIDNARNGLKSCP